MGDGRWRLVRIRTANRRGIGGGGPFPTLVGLSFENLLRSVGVPASPNAGSSGYGALPPGSPPPESAA